MRPPAGRAAPGGGVHSGPGWDPPGQTERQGIGVIGLTSKRIRRRPHAIVGSCAVSGQGCGPSCSQGGGGICRRSAAALRGGGLYSDRSGWGAPPANPIGGRPMAPAPAARSMVRPEIQGPYHTSDPSPTARRDLRRSYIVRSISLSKRQGGPPAQAIRGQRMQGQSKRRCGRPVRPSPRDLARALAAGSARDYADQRRACTSIEVQSLEPQGIPGISNPNRGIDVPGKTVYNSTLNRSKWGLFWQKRSDYVP